jgi:hypothetical protein
MSNNSRRGTKVSRRFEKEEKLRRERKGLPTEISRTTEIQTETIGEVLDVPDPRANELPN